MFELAVWFRLGELRGREVMAGLLYGPVNKKLCPSFLPWRVTLDKRKEKKGEGRGARKAWGV